MNSRIQPKCWNCNALVTFEQLEDKPLCPYCGADLSSYLHQCELVDEYQIIQEYQKEAQFTNIASPLPLNFEYMSFFVMMILTALLWVLYHELIYGGWP